jgi:hypothetical protein
LNDSQKIEVLQWGLLNSRRKLVRMIDTLANEHAAVRDALHFYDRVAGTGRGEGWTAADVLRLEEIRKLVGN